jgi:hypothetical protein
MWVTFPVTARSLEGRIEDRGTFVVSIAGKRVGTEDFQIRSAHDVVEDEGAVTIRVQQAGQPVAFETESDLVLNSHLWPKTYSWKQTVPRFSALRINFLVSPVTARYRTLNGATDFREFLLPKNVVVLDDNVLSQYEILVWRYLQTPGGKQHFSAFIPQEALPGKVTVDEAAPQGASIAGAKVNARRFVVTTELTRIELWTNKVGNLERVSLPTIHLLAVRR